MSSMIELREEGLLSQPGTLGVEIAPFEGKGGTADATGAATAALALRFEVARTSAEMEALAPAWRALDDGATSPSFFQSQAWCTHVVQVLLRSPSGRTVEPFVISAWDDDRIVAVWPLQLCRETGARVLTDLTRPFSQYADVVLATDSRIAPEAICRRLIEEARRRSRADALVLRKVRSDVPLGRVLASAARMLEAPQRAPWVDMAGHATFPAFHATAKAKTRKNVRNATHRLEKLGAITHQVERRAASMDAALERCFDLRSTWLESKGLTSTAFAHPAFADIVRGLADTAAHDIDVLSMMLMLDDQPISIHYGFLLNRRYYAFMAARNPDFDACSPGKVHLEHVLSACHALGIETVDFLAPDMPYKTVWATGTTETADYGLTWSLRGWLAIQVWRRRVRPAALRLFLSLPDRLRHRAAAGLRASAPRRPEA